MSIQLNHTICWCRDKRNSATFLAQVLGLPEPTEFGPFLVVELANGASIDFLESEGENTFQHYAFLISEAEFDLVFTRLHEQGLQHWADPHKEQAGEINRHDGGRGLYFDSPDGHLLEVITRPYGSGAKAVIESRS